MACCPNERLGRRVNIANKGRLKKKHLAIRLLASCSHFTLFNNAITPPPVKELG